ncbi:MAG: hypothetical protein CSYNP_01234 [Syntrophus sp. SKADARSKE-3]|nr:hypothetical protein [Syntrophus sp. SKADARSKE-3]
MDFLFLIKKLITPLFYPLSVILILLLSGLSLIFFMKKRKLGFFLSGLGFMLLLLSSYDVVTDVFLRQLENQYPPCLLTKTDPPPNIRRIVILGGGISYDPKHPISSHLAPDSLARVLEGVRLYKRIRGANIIVAGGAIFTNMSEADTMSRAAELMSVPQSDIITETKSANTEDQARILKAQLGSSPFILVTSAYHMPRSIMLFKKYGMSPIPAPTGYLSKNRLVLSPGTLFPSPDSIDHLQKAVHEYLGIFWIFINHLYTR